MPIRLFKPGFRTSEKVNACSFLAQLTYVRLITVVDDFGRYLANPRLLRSELWPLGDDRGADIPLEAFVTALQQLATPQKGVGDEEPLIILYTVGGTQYVQIGNWTERARSAASRYPDPTAVAVQMPGSCSADAVQMSTSPAPSPSPSPAPYSAPVPSPTPKAPAVPQTPDNAHFPEANVPTWQEVKRAADMGCIPEASAKRFFDHHEDNSLWLNRHGRLINWQSYLKTWADKDRQPKAGATVADKILHGKEYERVLARMKTLKTNAGDTWSPKDRAEMQTLKARRDELKTILGVTV